MIEGNMAPMVMVAIEGVSLAFLLIILAAYIFLPRSKSLKKDWFFISLSLELVAVLFDMVSWACETAPVSKVVQFSSNFIALIMTSFIVSAFGYYIVDMINERESLSRNVGHVITAANLLGVTVSVIAACFGKLFDVKSTPSYPEILVYDGNGFFYDFPVIISTLSLLVLFVLVLRYSKSLGRHKIVVFTIYFLLPVLSGIVEIFEDELQFSYVASALSMTIVYVMLQSTNINELLIREKLLHEISYVDQLTGLMNRRACDRDLALIQDDDTVSIGFCDLNGLKKINDEKGHKEGDQFLITFTEVITKYFPRDSVYRISGDEFVVIMRNMREEEFEKKIADLKMEISRNAGIAALGTITGTGDAIPTLIKKAEMLMYDDKKNFYRLNPEYKRGRSGYMDLEE